MGICKTCGGQVIYKNRFHNICESCGSEVNYNCWNCGEVINPSNPDSIESPFSGFHKCSSCGLFSMNEDIELINNALRDTDEYIKENKWDIVVPNETLPMVKQLTLNLLFKNNKKYFCEFGISTGKPKNELRKFHDKLNENNVEYENLFGDILGFIRNMDIDEMFKADILKKSIVTNSENIAVLDYFVCLGFLKKTKLKPATYIVISHDKTICKYLIDTFTYKCDKCGYITNETKKDSLKCDNCNYTYKKGKNKGEYKPMQFIFRDTICSSSNKILNYWK